MPSIKERTRVNLERLGFVRHQQPAIAFVLALCFVGMVFYFGSLAFSNRGLLDIDQADRLEADFKIDINTADWPEIVILPGIGEKLARAIVQHREACGPFKDIESIQNVSGIGERKFEQIEPFLLPISVNPH